MQTLARDVLILNYTIVDHMGTYEVGWSHSPEWNLCEACYTLLLKLVVTQALH